MKVNVAEAPDLCIGCGICTVICPASALAIEEREGELRPSLVDSCRECGRCLQLCPHRHPEREELSAQLFSPARFHQEIGWHTACWGGHSLEGEDRKNGSSGGLTTWFIRRCLEEGLVDRVINVAPTSNGLFEYQIRGESTLGESQGSAYYPVTLDGILQRVLEKDHRYLVTGLPCFIQGLRRAQGMNPLLKKRLSILVGIACGLCPTRHLAEVLGAAQGRVLGRGDRLHFRRKKRKARNAYDYEFSIERGGWGLLGKSSYGLYGFLWMNRYFSHRVCHFCDDTFAELADVSFMDAWLPQYSADGRGNNLVIVRDPRLNTLFSRCEGRAMLEAIEGEEVYQSQRLLVQYKKYGLPSRIEAERAKGTWFPPSRLSNGPADPLAARRGAHHLALAAWSKRHWPRHKKLGRLGVLLFLARSFLAHRQDIDLFRDWETIIPGLRAFKR